MAISGGKQSNTAAKIRKLPFANHHWNQNVAREEKRDGHQKQLARQPLPVPSNKRGKDCRA